LIFHSFKDGDVASDGDVGRLKTKEWRFETADLSDGAVSDRPYLISGNAHSAFVAFFASGALQT
jgi:hypothetical protein